MPTVRLRAPLAALAGGAATIPVEGATVGAALLALEALHPGLVGWILDEHGRLREHVNVNVNGVRGGEATAVVEDDKLYVLSAISGG